MYEPAYTLSKGINTCSQKLTGALNVPGHLYYLYLLFILFMS